jgi:hypothetical protein
MKPVWKRAEIRLASVAAYVILCRRNTAVSDGLLGLKFRASNPATGAYKPLCETKRSRI